MLVKLSHVFKSSEKEEGTRHSVCSSLTGYNIDHPMNLLVFFSFDLRKIVMVDACILQIPRVRLWDHVRVLSPWPAWPCLGYFLFFQTHCLLCYS